MMYLILVFSFRGKLLCCGSELRLLFDAVQNIVYGVRADMHVGSEERISKESDIFYQKNIYT